MEFVNLVKMRSKGKALDRHHSQSTPNLLAVEAEKEAEKEEELEAFKQSWGV